MRTSVRGRLLAGLLVLVALGLAGVDLVTWTALRSFLLSRLNGQISSTIHPIEGQLAGEFDLEGVTADPAIIRRVVPPGVFAQIRTNHRVIVEISPTDSAGNPIDPSLPTPLPRSRVVTVPTDNGSGSFRLEAFGTRFSTVTIVALPLSPVTDTLHRLVLIEVVASIVTLAAITLLSLVVIRVGLHPLDEMADTAAAIAEGDLTRRVTTTDGRTEAGRLGLALNAMLGQIEAAFANRRVSEERLRRFVSDASHELRTPLTSIRGYAELFRSGASERPDDLAMAMGRIESEAARMGAMVEDLLLLARLDQDRPLGMRPVDLAAVARDAARDAAVVSPAGAHPITIESEAPVWVTGDDARLRQVATNLVSNAVRHTPDGTAITVRTAVEGPVGVLEVADTGPGLSAEDVDRVWDRFWRASRTPAGGSGLGLSIVAAIAAAHRGRASVRSAPGQGARFRVEIPLAAGPATDAPPAVGGEPAEPESPPHPVDPAADGSAVSGTGA
jgi:two-component system, OmpR family, sensor kinase